MIPIPACVLATTRVRGRLVAVAEPETSVARGDVVAVVDHPGGREEVRAPSAGFVAGPLKALAQAVAVGEAVVWLWRR
jgi:predicted deacylase